MTQLELELVSHTTITKQQAVLRAGYGIGVLVGLGDGSVEDDDDGGSGDEDGNTVVLPREAAAPNTPPDTTAIDTTAETAAITSTRGAVDNMERMNNVTCAFCEVSGGRGVGPPKEEG